MSNNRNFSLTGKTIVLTRAQEQQFEGYRLLEELGATVLGLPALVITDPDQWGPLDDALQELESFHWIVFSSGNGVKAVEARLGRLNKSLANRPSSLRIAAVGKKTAGYLEQIGARADFIPPNYVADSLVEHFPVSGWGLKMLLPRVQSGGREFLPEAFRSAGAHVIEVAAYQSCCPETIPTETAMALKKGEVDLISFCSGKTAKHTAKLLKKSLGNNWKDQIQQVKIISIGPQTTLSCKKYFERLDGEADPHDLEGLTNECIKALQLDT